MSRIFLTLAGIAGVGLVVTGINLLQNPRGANAPAIPAFAPLPTRVPTLAVPPLALVAGHSGNDSGAVCPDGTREVDITTDVARRAKAILEARGYRVDILQEFDARLSATRRDYAPAAFLAIHVDSCIDYASGYKVARAANSAIPQEDDRLVRCVTAAYAAATLLPFHEGSITNNMLHYHGLNEINPQTPGAIIDLGFLGSNGDLLKNKRELLAQGVADGVDNFVRGNECR